MRVALVQTTSGPDRDSNIEHLVATLARAADLGAELVLLPEACAYRGAPEPGLAEDRSGPTLSRLGSAAAQYGVAVLVGGMWLATDDPARPYNAALFIDPSGQVAAEYRKVHLFRLQTAEVSENEGDYTTPGDHLVTVDYRGFRLGLSICYDLRFPELYRALARAGADVLCVPSNFSAITGAVHWEPLLRARAIENLCYVLAPAQDGVSDDGFATFGHTMAIDPWGRVLSTAEEGPGLVVVDLDPGALTRARAALNAPHETAPEVYSRPVTQERASG